MTDAQRKPRAVNSSLKLGQWVRIARYFEERSFERAAVRMRIAIASCITEDEVLAEFDVFEEQIRSLRAVTDKAVERLSQQPADTAPSRALNASTLSTHQDQSLSRGNPRSNP